MPVCAICGENVSDVRAYLERAYAPKTRRFPCAISRMVSGWSTNSECVMRVELGDRQERFAGAAHSGDRPDWVRPYWFERPLALPRGTRIGVVANLDDPDLMSKAFSATARPSKAVMSIVRLALNLVSADAKPSAP
jgi:hypothetical protein